MTNALYDHGREAFLNGDISWRDSDIRMILIDTADYSVNLATHEFLSSVPGAARVAVSGALGGKTSTNGVADANDVTLTSVSGDQCEALILYRHTGTDSTSNLIAYIDSASGLPATPTGGNVTIIWGETASKIFKL